MTLPVALEFNAALNGNGGFGLDHAARRLDIASADNEVAGILMDRLFEDASTLGGHVSKATATNPVASSTAPRIEPAFSNLVGVLDFPSGDTPTGSPVSDEQVRILNGLRTAFETEPLEDGMGHPAEEILRKALLDTEASCVLGWTRELALDTAHPNLAASVLRCLGRLEHPGTGAWRTELIRSALGTDEVELRDAAAQAAETWGGDAVRQVLETHAEPLPWLRDYIRDVVEDLEE